VPASLEGAEAMNTGIGSPAIVADNSPDTIAKRVHYSPPWADLSIIGVAGSSGSGKSTLSHAIVSKLNLPWVVILSMVSELSWGPNTYASSRSIGLVLQGLNA
jgi:ABC-type protease/lipase transport system fused ATPase/permease subunit